MWCVCVCGEQASAGSVGTSPWLVDVVTQKSGCSKQQLPHPGQMLGSFDTHDHQAVLDECTAEACIRLQDHNNCRLDRSLNLSLSP